MRGCTHNDRAPYLPLLLLLAVSESAGTVEREPPPARFRESKVQVAAFCGGARTADRAITPPIFILKIFRAYNQRNCSWQNIVVTGEFGTASTAPELANLKVAQLRVLAQQLGIRGYLKLKKAEAGSELWRSTSVSGAVAARPLQGRDPAERRLPKAHREGREEAAEASAELPPR